MCLIVFALHQHPDWPLIISANRDEFHPRPTAEAHFWDEQPAIFAGRDLEAGGTWLGINQSGNITALTNYRESTQKAPGNISRGKLCSDYLTGSQSAAAYLQSVKAQALQYAGFNLLCGNAQQLHYYSNRSSAAQQLSPGIYGLSNGLLNSPWPKVETSKAKLAKLIKQGDIKSEHLIDCLQDRKTPPKHQQPNTGVSPTWEHLLSSPFIVSDNYGTRCTTAVMFHRSGSISFTEQSYNAQGERTQIIQQQF